MLQYERIWFPLFIAENHDLVPIEARMEELHLSMNGVIDNIAMSISASKNQISLAAKVADRIVNQKDNMIYFLDEAAKDEVVLH